MPTTTYPNMIKRLQIPFATKCLHAPRNLITQYGRSVTVKIIKTRFLSLPQSAIHFIGDYNDGHKACRITTVGIRELKTHDSKLLREVREQGEVIDIIYYGEVIAHLIPTKQANPLTEN